MERLTKSLFYPNDAGNFSGTHLCIFQKIAYLKLSGAAIVLVPARVKNKSNNALVPNIILISSVLLREGRIYAISYRKRWYEIC